MASALSFALGSTAPVASRRKAAPSRARVIGIDVEDELVEVGEGGVERAQRAAGVGRDVARPQSAETRRSNTRLGGLDQPALEILALGVPFCRH